MVPLFASASVTARSKTGIIVFIWTLYLDSTDWRLGVMYMGPYGLDHIMYGLLSLDRIIGVYINADLH